MKRPTASAVFWDLISMARDQRDEWESTVGRLKNEYLKMFLLDFNYLASELDTDEFQTAVAKLAGAASEDDSRDVAEWVVLQGKKVYDRIYQDHHSLPSGGDFDAEYTEAYSIACIEHEKRFGELEPDRTEDEMYRFRYPS